MQDLTDRQLKERLIGATVLVLFMVLIVPIFLDGKSYENEIIRSQVILPGQHNQERKQTTIVLDRNRSQPVPTTSLVSSNSQDDTFIEENVLQDESSSVINSVNKFLPKIVSEDESETGFWAVQLGSFSSKENAERLAVDLRESGFAAFISNINTKDGVLQRVRVGPQKNKDLANDVVLQLTKLGHQSSVVPHP